MARLTITAINKALESRGHAERLFPGTGYFYFAEGIASSWPSTMVCVSRLNDLSLEQWIAEHESLSKAIAVQGSHAL